MCRYNGPDSWRSRAKSGGSIGEGLVGLEKICYTIYTIRAEIAKRRTNHAVTQHCQPSLSEEVCHLARDELVREALKWYLRFSWRDRCFSYVFCQ